MGKERKRKQDRTEGGPMQSKKEKRRWFQDTTCTFDVTEIWLYLYMELEFAHKEFLKSVLIYQWRFCYCVFVFTTKKTNLLTSDLQHFYNARMFD